LFFIGFAGLGLNKPMNKTIYQKLGGAIRNLKNTLEAGEVKNCVEFIIDELAYAFESDPAFNENELRNAVYKKEQQPKRTATRVKQRLAYLRKEIEAERISYGEIAELQSLKKYIDPSDVLLLEWAGVKEGTATRVKTELIDRAPLLKELASKIKEALNDCWGYHSHLIKETDKDVKKSELLDYLYDCNLKDWEDVGFFIGYLRGLDDGVELLSEAKPQKLSNKIVSK
jgi:hypothetical protein